jgi:SP family arabinose:H+ symporter-like MFS transporter
MINVDQTAITAATGKIFHTEFWRGMLGCETFPDILFVIVIFFIPESPRWLIVKGRGSEAKGILQKIYCSETEATEQMGITQASISSSSKSEWKALLEPGILKAVLIGSAIAILGQFMGVNAVLYYGPQILGDAGLSSDSSLLSQVLVGCVNMFTTIIALFIIDKVGRKQLIYWGVSGMIISLLMLSLFFSKGANCILGTDSCLDSSSSTYSARPSRSAQLSS